MHMKLENFHKKPTIIMTSPYLRCVETAIDIATELPDSFNNKIYIQNQLSEYFLI